jgi:hypothetical protein
MEAPMSHSIRSWRGTRPTVGARVYVDPQACVIGRVTLGDDASVWPMAVLRGDVEAIAVGADGWVAGLVNALPSESVTLVDLAKAGRTEEALKLYAWFLPLLRFDTVPKFVQLIKLVQAEVEMGSEAVRAPRLPLSDKERKDALAIVRRQLRHRVQRIGTRAMFQKGRKRRSPPAARQEAVSREH